MQLGFQPFWWLAWLAGWDLTGTFSCSGIWSWLQMSRVRYKKGTAGHLCCKSGTKHECLWHTFVSE